MRPAKKLLGPGVAAALLLGAVAVQYARTGWPFAPAHSPARDREAATPGQAAHGDHAEHAPPAGDAPAGYAPLMLEPPQAAAMNLVTAPVEERAFTRTVRTVATVVPDETRTEHVHVKVRGWITDIFVDFVGKKVRAGEPLCAIYSQEVYAAELEFLSVLERAGSRPTPDPLLEAARQRLSLWDVPRREIERLAQTRIANRSFPLLAPRSGTVVAKEALEGMYVDPASELYTISDLSRLWVLADIYETDVPYVHVGDRAKLAIEGREAPIEARLSFLYPTIDEATRTRKARFVLDNPKGRLLPGAFVTVTMEAPLGTGLAIPESAVIRTGTRAIVFVVHQGATLHLQPREVTLGPLVGDRYLVARGVEAGERVATGAQFLLDSESRLKATSAPGGGHAHH